MLAWAQNWIKPDSRKWQRAQRYGALFLSEACKTAARDPYAGRINASKTTSKAPTSETASGRTDAAQASTDQIAPIGQIAPIAPISGGGDEAASSWGACTGTSLEHARLAMATMPRWDWRRDDLPPKTTWRHRRRVDAIGTRKMRAWSSRHEARANESSALMQRMDRLEKLLQRVTEARGNESSALMQRMDRLEKLLQSVTEARGNESSALMQRMDRREKSLLFGSDSHTVYTHTA